MAVAYPLPPLLFSWCCIYYWSLFQPLRLNYVMLAIAGLAQDLILGFPMGFSILGFVLMRLAIGYFRRLITIQQFWAIWIAYLIVAAAMAVLAVAMLVLTNRLPLMPALIQVGYTAGITVICYPLIHLLCNRIYAIIPTLQLRSQSL